VSNIVDGLDDCPLNRIRRHTTAVNLSTRNFSYRLGKGADVCLIFALVAVTAFMGKL
jgi:aconitase B